MSSAASMFPKSTISREVMDLQTPRHVLLRISPEWAAKLLETYNTRNRPLSPIRVQNLAGEIFGGLWMVTSDTIKFSGGAQPRLIDGQHRLAACLLAGVAIETWVAFGVDPEAFAKTDRGKTRKVYDDLAVEGRKNTRALAAVAALVWLDENDRIEEGEQSRVPEEAIKATVRAHPELEGVVRVVDSRFRRKIPVSLRILTFCWFGFSRRDPEAAERFFVDLADGVNLAANDPVLLLRNRLNRDARQQAKTPNLVHLALLIKAWNARRQGRTVELLIYRPGAGEPFPVIA